MGELQSKHVQDGMMFGTGNGYMYAAFKPKWWMLWRWVWWWVPIKRRKKIVVVMDSGFRMRAVQVETLLPHVPGPNAYEQTETPPVYTTQTTTPNSGNSSEG